MLEMGKKGKEKYLFGLQRAAYKKYDERKCNVITKSRITIKIVNVPKNREKAISN
jgi:hypothetical protein